MAWTLRLSFFLVLFPQVLFVLRVRCYFLFSATGSLCICAALPAGCGLPLLSYRMLQAKDLYETTATAFLLRAGRPHSLPASPSGGLRAPFAALRLRLSYRCSLSRPHPSPTVLALDYSRLRQLAPIHIDVIARQDKLLSATPPKGLPAAPLDHRGRLRFAPPPAIPRGYSPMLTGTKRVPS